MTSPLEYQALNPQLPDPVSEAKTESGSTTVITRFERYKVLVRKLAHHLSGTGEVMTKEERGELREIMRWGAAPQQTAPWTLTPPSAASKLIFRTSRTRPIAK